METNNEDMNTIWPIISYFEIVCILVIDIPSRGVCRGGGGPDPSLIS